MPTHVSIEGIISQLTTEEKIALVSGTDFMYTNPVPRLLVPSIQMSDGPHGLRVQTDGGDNGVTGSLPATSFPTAATLASGWNEKNAERMGEAIGKEAALYGVQVVLGPGANLKRNPLLGRNFEYFSEDPLLSGKLAAAEIRGIQSVGVSACVKHFALNNAENYRFMGNSVCDERTARELYLKSFQIAVTEGKPDAVMCAYNRVNGVYCSENNWLLTDVLRREWGFDGLTMTDWGATRDRVQGVLSGLDLEMPGDTAICRKQLFDAVKNGTLPMQALDEAAGRVLRLVIRHQTEKETIIVDHEANDLLAAEIAEDCAVLLKNDGVLPLAKTKKTIVVGDLFVDMRYQGAGSSMINPYRLTTPKAAFDENGVEYTFARGFDGGCMEIEQALIDEAVSAAQSSDVVLAFLGLTDEAESEGLDRPHMRLPQNQLALMEALVQTGKRIVVVLFGGSPIELPFADKVSGILAMYLPGQNGGTAAYRLLFGESNPCGKLAETWAIRYEDVPFAEEYSQEETEVYKESVFVGYRYFCTAKKPVRYPFGYGLSYTKFAISNMQVRDDGDFIDVSCLVENVGKMRGAEVVQLYVSSHSNNFFSPERELRAFQKVYLNAGESTTATLRFAKSDLARYHIDEKRTVLEQGEYLLRLCTDCTACIEQSTLFIQGETVACPYTERVMKAYLNADMGAVNEEIFSEMSGLVIERDQKTTLHMESKFTELRRSPLGRLLVWAVLLMPRSQLRKARRARNETERRNKIKGAVFLQRILESGSLRSMSMSAGNRFPYNFAEGFLALAKGKIFRGIGHFCKKIKAPRLPKDNR